MQDDPPAAGAGAELPLGATDPEEPVELVPDSGVLGAEAEPPAEGGAEAAPPAAALGDAEARTVVGVREVPLGAADVEFDGAGVAGIELLDEPELLLEPPRLMFRSFGQFPFGAVSGEVPVKNLELALFSLG